MKKEGCFNIFWAMQFNCCQNHSMNCFTGHHVEANAAVSVGATATANKDVPVIHPDPTGSPYYHHYFR